MSKLTAEQINEMHQVRKWGSKAKASPSLRMSELGNLSEQLADEVIAGRGSYKDFLEVKAPVKQSIKSDLMRRMSALGEGVPADFVVKKPSGQSGMATMGAMAGGALTLAAGELIARTPDLQATIHDAGAAELPPEVMQERDMYNEIRKKKLLESMR